jgi:hypothetical protein
MSATRDQSQKVSFVYSNLYSIYQKGKAEAIVAKVPSAFNSGAVIKSAEVASQLDAPLAVNPRSHILKTDDLRNQASSVKVAEYNPTAFIGKRVARPAVLPPAQQSTAAISSLKENLKSLNDLHSRLRFMLQELEELVKK